MLYQIDPVCDKFCDDNRNEDGESYCCESGDRPNSCGFLQVTKVLLHRVSGASDFKFELRVLCCHFENGFVHELWPQLCGVYGGEIYIADEFVLMILGISFKYLI